MLDKEAETLHNIVFNERRNILSWDDEKRQQAVDAYVAAEPTPETSTEIIKEIAEDLKESVNGVRMILMKAEVYVKKTPGAAPAKASTSTRVSKADAIATLTSAIQDSGQEVDEEIVSKLTGKAAVYFATVINNING